MKISRIILGITALCIIHPMVLAQGKGSPGEKLKIYPAKANLEVGESLQFQAVYVDTADVEYDTTATWAVYPDSLGTIDTDGLFIAELPGECVVIGTLDTLSDWADVTIEMEEDEDDSTEYQYRHLVIVPRDTLVLLGEEVQFAAYYPDSADFPGTSVDTTLVWSLEGMPVGQINDSTGLFTSSATGFAVVHAQLDEWEGSALVVVIDPSADPTGIDTIIITRDKPSPKGGTEYTTMATLTEGELWTIGGLPHPLNVLNGGRVYFPVGALTEDIRIHIQLPGFTRTFADSVGFTHEGIIGGMEFQVFVNDTLVEPYTFGTPLIVGLVYKRGLISKMNIDPATLGLYFATISGDTVTFDTTGIGYTVADLCLNRIFSTVAHFSALAVAGEVGTAEPLGVAGTPLPSGLALHANYPNPFNPATTIRFNLPFATEARLVVYDLLGREIATLVQGQRPAGLQQVSWNGRDASGREVPSGVYISRLTMPGGQARTIKMLLLK
ncbi:MAG: T9SS type A sorting domain-containing protein [Fidelibacterota bacterium]|nr:MAG: T9SS type A sorting domain-containing protein [Candidatus Neomarinimicrobiota bacterium]